MWLTYRRLRHAKSDPLVKTEVAAGALEYCYLTMRGYQPSFAEIARYFYCEKRQLIYYARRIASVLGNGRHLHNEKGN